MKSGSQIGKYRLIRPLGQGGEGLVWLAMHMKTEQLWAVKEINRSDGAMEYHELAMFKKLRHPSLPIIADVIETEEAVFLVMEYIRGETLDSLLVRCGRLSAGQVIDAALQILGGLAYLHDQKRRILHLDLKPSNITLTPEGKVRLIDLGAAHIMGETLSHRYVTDGYSPPEMYDQEGVPDICSDLYALGALMYVLVSGVRYSSVLIKSKVPGCPEALGNVIKKCLLPDKKQRFQDDGQLKNALEKVRRSGKREHKRTKLWVAVLLCICALGAVFSAGGEILKGQRSREWNYERLLKEAACSDLETAAGYYLRALYIQPGRTDAYEQYLRLCDGDGVFSVEEDTLLREMLHTIPVGFSETYEEMLRKDPEAYGQFAYMLGLVYWYDYPSESGEGKRIGLGWFEKARDAADELEVHTGTGKLPEWRNAAAVYCQMGVFSGSIAQEGESGNNDLILYWDNLQNLLERAEMWFGSDRLKLRFCRETMRQLISLVSALDNRGIAVDSLQKTVELVFEQAEEAAGAEETWNSDTQEIMEEIREDALDLYRILTNMKKVREREENQGEKEQSNTLQNEEEACTEKGS